MKNKIFPAAFYTATLIFLVVYFRSIGTPQLEAINYSYPLLLLSTAVALVFRFWGSAVWLLILRSLGVKKFPGVTVLIYAYAKSWLGRYIPGTVVWIFGKVYFAAKLGVPQTTLAVSSVIEGAMQVAVLMIMSSLSLLVAGEFGLIGSEMRMVILGIIITILFAISPPVFNRLILVFVKFFKKGIDTSKAKLDYPTFFRAFVLYGVGFFLSGFSYFLFAASISDIFTWNHFWFLLGAFNLAGALGIAAVFVPSGLFVREGVQVLLLSAVVSMEVALVISIAARLWSFLVDIMFFLCAYVILILNQKQHNDA